MFIVETEDSASIKEALSKLKEWNPDWNPAFFMCDHAQEEINSLEEEFPGSIFRLMKFVSLTLSSFIVLGTY